jgi:hypothetical protein
MFEPLLGLLTRDYVWPKSEPRPNSGVAGPTARSATEVMGLRSNPCLSGAELLQCWLRCETGATAEAVGLGKA